MKHIEVVAAVIENENQYLCVQRNANKYDYISYKYEFPGGKVEPNETNEEALTREIQEELNLEIQIQKHIITVEHTYPDFKISMHTYLCSSVNRTLTLNEHVDHKWLNKLELPSLDWAGADVPIVDYLLNN
jgi:8-oxo-dGTP diphosphatase